ncbi:MFS transporter [Paenalkalicoccus suaedae]|uniref:MFS transporter n=1 Tax=Paenalkalicoccus suaedae TaxID=2592382 RepID=A0A859FAN2_9BACI|nr:MFS transporter [Paenalkalicoccus suaedae]QKS70309.1 MFS transporter [Paenalkalicoccus suaedae]
MNPYKLILAGLPMIAVSYGLSRFSFGLMLPYINQTLEMQPATTGIISSLSYLAYCVAILLAMIYSKRVTPKTILIVAGTASVVGLSIIAGSPNPLILGIGIFVAGLSTGFASPPYAGIVRANIADTEQNQTNSWINSGTSIGTALAGIVALVIGDQWRVSYLAFMIVALAVLAINYKVLPKNHSSGANRAIRFGKADVQRSLKLIIASMLLGISSAAYWTFSRDYIVNLEEAPAFLGQGFWIIIGLAGLLGGTVGAVINRFGLVVAFRLSVIVLALSSATIVATVTSALIGVLSAILFGSSYIFMSGVLILWGIRIFKDSPSLGIGIPFIFLAAGQVIGSAVAGGLAGAIGFDAVFLVYAAVGFVALVLKPKE